MKLYKVTLAKEEREELEQITRKGSHQSQKVINALILLNCDEGEHNNRRALGEDVAKILRISLRKVDRVKRRFVEEGLEGALGGRQGRRTNYARKADGDLEARLVGLKLQPTAYALPWGAVQSVSSGASQAFVGSV